MNRLKKSVYLSVAGLSAIALSACSTNTRASHNTIGNTAAPGASSFWNPIMDNGADPWMTSYDNKYYLTMTTGNNVTIYRSDSPSDIAAGSNKVIWSPSASSQLADIWAPELHHIGDHWYVYFAADKNQDNTTHRMYVLRSADNNPYGSYKLVGQLMLPANQWAIDGTVLQLNHRMYFIWSGWPSRTKQVQNLYIAEMASPTSIASKTRTLISRPTYPWETSVSPINEGPEVLQHNGKTFLTYSANASWTNAYTVGMLTLQGSNPLIATNWAKHKTPVFSSAHGIFGPGHASFIQFDHENWIVYHSARYDGAGWDRVIRMQPFTYARDGSPVFGSPDAPSKQMTLKMNTSSGWKLAHAKAAADGSVELTVTVDKSGDYTIGIPYQTDGKGDASVKLEMANSPSLTLTFAGTDGQQSMQYQAIYLNKGSNKLKLTVPAGARLNKTMEVAIKPN